MEFTRRETIAFVRRRIVRNKILVIVLVIVAVAGTAFTIICHAPSSQPTAASESPAYRFEIDQKKISNFIKSDSRMYAGRNLH